MTDGEAVATPAGDETDRARRIWTLLRQRADSGGFLRFDQFMEIALYAPGVGFYTRPNLRLGREGEFYTAAHASPLFGATLVRRTAEEYRRLGRPADFRVVEVGAGDGTLFADFLAAVSVDPDLGSRAVEYDLVERSPSLGKTLTDRLASSALPPNFTARVVPGVSAVGPFRGVLIANELLDAFPVRRLVMVAGEPGELGVALEADRAVWSTRPLIAPLPGPSLPSGVPDGTILDVSPRAEAFVREMGDLLLEGTALFFDYGDEESELLSRFPRGSLTAIRRHRVVEDPLAHPGTRDLSTEVNFSRIRAAARRAGLREIAYERQAEALGRWGFGEVRDSAVRSAPSSEESVRRALGAKNLLFGFERFRVLELHTPGGSAVDETGAVPAADR